MDHLGSASVMMGGDGSLWGGTAARYKPFGGYAGAKPANYIQNRGFTGHDRTQADDALGIVYMNARVYMPGTGKFLTADTLVPDPTNSQSYNRYAYVNNRPLMLVDPTGHYGLCIQGGVDDVVRVNGPIYDMCQEMASSGEFGDPGDCTTDPYDYAAACLVITNNNEDIAKGEQWLLNHGRRGQEDVTILGYSWGGGAALELVWHLYYTQPNFIVHNLVLLDAVLEGRDWLPEASQQCAETGSNDTWYPCKVLNSFTNGGPIKDRSYYPVPHGWIDGLGDYAAIPSNVVFVLNIAAGSNPYTGFIPFGRGIDYVTRVGGSNALAGISNYVAPYANHCSLVYITGCPYNPSNTTGNDYQTWLYDFVVKWIR